MPSVYARFGLPRKQEWQKTSSMKTRLIIKRIGKLGLEGAVFLAVEGVAQAPALVVDEEEIVAGAEDIVQAEIQPGKGVGVVVLDGGGGQPLIVEIVENFEIQHVVGERRLADLPVVDAVAHFHRQPVGHFQPGTE